MPSSDLHTVFCTGATSGGSAHLTQRPPIRMVQPPAPAPRPLVVGRAIGRPQWTLPLGQGDRDFGQTQQGDGPAPPDVSAGPVVGSQPVSLDAITLFCFAFAFSVFAFATPRAQAGRVPPRGCHETASPQPDPPPERGRWGLSGQPRAGPRALGRTSFELTTWRCGMVPTQSQLTALNFCHTLHDRVVGQWEPNQPHRGVAWATAPLTTVPTTASGAFNSLRGVLCILR